MDRADDILPLGVVNDLMRIGRRQAALTDPLIGAKQADLFRNGFADEGFEGRIVNAINNTSDNLTSAADRADNGFLSRASSARARALEPLADMPVLGLAADESFIDLDLAKQLSLGAILHRNTDAMAHIPSRFIGAGAKHPMDLKGAHAFLGMVHEESDLEPLDKRIFGILEDRSSDDREPIAALVASLAEPMERAGFDLPDLQVAAARTMDAIRPTTLGEVSLAIGFGFELREKLSEFHKQEYALNPAWCQVTDNRPNSDITRHRVTRHRVIQSLKRASRMRSQLK